MALPTAATYGYGYYPTVTSHPDVACNCLREWLPVFRRLCILKGYGDIRVWQCTGGADASAGTHTRGGACDWGGIDFRKIMLAREMGMQATWGRNWSGNVHTHGVLADCPHNDPAEYQIAAVRLRRDGLGWRGLQGPDPYPAPSQWRSWSDGLERGKSEIKRLTSPTAPAPTAPTAPTPIPAPPSEEDELMAITVKNPSTGEEWPLEKALWSIWSYVFDGRDDPSETWEQPIKRSTGTTTVLQEIADTRTQVQAIAVALEELAKKVDALPKA